MSKDLFEETTMTFGEHLEVLRVHLWRAIIGIAIGVAISLVFADSIIQTLQTPVVDAMKRHFAQAPVDAGITNKGFVERAKEWWAGKSSDPKPAASPAVETPAPAMETGNEPVALSLTVNAVELEKQLSAAKTEGKEEIVLKAQVTLDQLGGLRKVMREDEAMPRTDGPDEAFMIYIKVALISGLVIASPWVFYQLWLFVAAGLYHHERKYVYTYLPMSLFLFLGGAAFCFFIVIPYVLDFLFSFNASLNLRPEIKIATWLSFAMIVSLMFGISFQLPLVMLFLERISIFTETDYREKRRMSILAISIISMILTPSDPISMTLMMVPLLLLYELGILLCRYTIHHKTPFETEPA